MLRISYVSPRFGENTVTFHKNVIRFGRSLDCELCMADCGDDRVAPHHGELLRENGRYLVVESGGSNGIWVNGARTRRARLQGGEHLRLGSPDGPELVVEQIELKDDPLEMATETFTVAPETLGRENPLMARPSVYLEGQARASAQSKLLQVNGALLRIAPTISSASLPAAARNSQAPRSEEGVEEGPERTLATRVAMGAARSLLKILGRPSAEVQHWLGRAQRDIHRARAKARGQSSGDTMIIMAQALMGLRDSGDSRTRRWKWGLAALAVASLLLLTVLSTVIYFQHKRIGQLVSEKVAIDSQIQDTFAQMVYETDETRLAVLEARLQILMGDASSKILQVQKVAPKRAEKLEAPQDALEVEIRKILHSFNAETYAIPPIFKVALQAQISDLLSNKGLHSAYERKQLYWPAIQRALAKQKLPEELGYITYTESHFDPTAQNAKSGASGMWQLMEEVARGCGIVVRGKRDDRFSPSRSSDAAACYLSKVLVEFGEESFMLVLASYNRGENGVRRALHRVASEPGGYRMRDFWHLYRLKLLPEETRDYVPRVIAAAIVFGNPEKYGLAPKAKAPAE